MYMMNTIDLIGNIAVFLSILGFFPVVHNIYNTKKTNNFPYKSIFIALLAHSSWFIYGLYKDTSATEYSGFIFVLFYLFMLHVKMTN